MSPARKAELILVLITLIWGTTFVLIKSSLEYCSTFLFLALRFFIAALFVRVWFYQELKSIPPATWAAGSIIGFFLSAGNFFQRAGLGFTTASKSAFFTSTVVIYVPMIAVFLARERLRLSSILAVIIVTIGLFLLTSPQGQGFNWGDFLTIFCAIAFAFQLVFIFDQVFLASEWKFWVSLLYLSVIASSLVFFLQLRYQKETTATKAAIIYCLEPLFASGIAYLSIGETFTTIGIIGAGVVIAGILFSD